MFGSLQLRDGHRNLGQKWAYSRTMCRMRRESRTEPWKLDPNVKRQAEELAAKDQEGRGIRYRDSMVREVGENWEGVVTSSRDFGRQDWLWCQITIPSENWSTHRMKQPRVPEATFSADYVGEADARRSDWSGSGSWGYRQACASLLRAILEREPHQGLRGRLVVFLR